MPLDKAEATRGAVAGGRRRLSRPRPAWPCAGSGGGYRAMIFHLGCCGASTRLGYLARLDRISSVSGARSPPGCWACAGASSILPGGVARGLVTQVVEPIRAFAHHARWTWVRC